MSELPNPEPNNVYHIEEARTRRQILADNLAKVSILRVEAEQGISEPGGDVA